MDMRTVCRLIKACVSIDSRLSIRQIRLFGNQADNIHTESIYSFFQPPVHHVKYFFPDFWIIPVQIRLFFRKQMQIIHIRFFIIIPCRPGETGAPVIRFLSIFSISPDIIVTIWIVFRLSTLYKPWMFIGGMVDYQIHHDLDSMFMSFGKHPFKIFHCSELGHNCTVIADIISVIIIRGLIYRG